MPLSRRRFVRSTLATASGVPLVWNDEGLPIGIMFAGRPGDEGTLFRLARQLEVAHPWADRRPPGFA